MKKHKRISAGSFSDLKPVALRLSPFLILLATYESFKFFSASLEARVNYTLAPHFDKTVFGGLPTAYLQKWLWHGHVTWYDIILYLPYLLFFLIPLALALLVWKTREKYYWHVVGTFMLMFFAGFATYILFPAAPPWMASANHYIPPIVHVTSYIWGSVGIHNYSSLYGHTSPDAVAAVPSIHSACATLFSIFIFKIYGKRWGAVSLIYPILIYVGVIYTGEHYFFDVVAGMVYAVVAYYAAPLFYKQTKKYWKKQMTRLSAAMNS